MCRKTAEGLILTVGDNLRPFTDQDHEKRNQRPGDEQNHAGEQVNGENKDQDAERNERRDDQLRQILAEIGVQGFDSLHRGCGQLAGPFGAGISGTKVLDMGEEFFAQVGFDPHGHNIGADFVQPGQQGAPGNNE